MRNAIKSILARYILVGLLSPGCGVQDRIKPIPDRYIVTVGKGDTVLVNKGPYTNCFGKVQDSNETNDMFQVKTICASDLIEVKRTEIDYLGKLDISNLEKMGQEVRILSYPNEYCFGKIVSIPKPGVLIIDTPCYEDPIEVSLSEIKFIKSFME